MVNLRWDPSFAARMLVNDPVFKAAAVITLARGIGLNAAVFSAVDPITFLGVLSVLCGVALFATFWPARRAASVDPMQAE